MRSIVKILSVAAVLLSVFASRGAAQNNVQGNYTPLYDTKELFQTENETQDTLGGKKLPKKRKPLLSLYFNDSLKTEKVFEWNYNPYTNDVTEVPVDTLLDLFHRDYFFQREHPVGNIYLGNLGAPVTPYFYAERADNFNIAFLNPYAEYIFRPDNVPFYNGKTPFTQFTYISSGQKMLAEEQFGLIHNQNISPSTSFNITYRNNNTRGMYENQNSKNKNLSLAFAHTGRAYSVHMGYIYNTGIIQENGGVLDQREIRDTLIDLPRNIRMNLEDAKTVYRGSGFYFTQTAAFPLSRRGISDTTALSARVIDKTKDLSNETVLFIGTTVLYDAYRKTYTDTKAASNDYYQHWYLNPTQSRDSIRESSLDLMLFAQLQPYQKDGILSMVGGGIGYSKEKYYNFEPEDYLTTYRDAKEGNMFIYANARGRYRKYVDWSANLKYYPAGSRSQDLTVGGKLDLTAFIHRKPLIFSVEAKFENRTPNFWARNYVSNHFIWHNVFGNMTRTEIKGAFKVPSIRFEAGVTQTIETNKIYYNAQALPAQYGKALSVTGVYLNKNFVIGGLNLNHSLLLQLTSDEEVAPVPLFAANLSYFYRFHIVSEAVLQVQVGLDGYYNTEFYSYGYNPAVSQFYNQRMGKTGNYPWLDAYVTAKWKRLRILVKVQHLNYELFGGRNYFSTYDYPLNRRMFKLGISWSFYD